MKNIIMKIAAVTFLGAVLPLSACHMGGTDMKARNFDENVGIVMDADECPDKNCPDGCPAPNDDCPDCKDGKDCDGDKCPDGGCDKEKPHPKPPIRGGRRGRRPGRIVRPIPEPIEEQPK